MDPSQQFSRISRCAYWARHSRMIMGDLAKIAQILTIVQMTRISMEEPCGRREARQLADFETI